MKGYVAILLAALALTEAAPSPKPCPLCRRRGHSFISSPAYSRPIYTETAPIYTQSAPIYTQSAQIYTQSAPVYSSPVIHETVVSHPAPVVHETVVSHPAPVVHQTVVSQPAVPQPHVIGSYTTQTVGAAEYIPVKTTVHTTSNERYTVKVPVEYNYHYERPSQHTTVYEHGYNAPVSSVVAPAVTSSVVSAPVSSSYYGSAPVSTSYYGSAPVSTSYYGSAPVSSTVYESAPVSNTVVASAPVSSSSVYRAPSTYYSKAFSASSSNHVSENVISQTWK